MVAIAEDMQAVSPLETLRARQTPPLFDIIRASPAPTPAPEIMEVSLLDVPPYGSKGYNRLMHSRPRHLLRFVEKGCAVLFVDVDTAWLKNPFLDIARAGKFDLFIIDDGDGRGQPAFQKEEWSEMKAQGHKCEMKRTNFCGCFQYMIPTQPMIELARDWTHAMETEKYKKEGNQHAFNSVLCSHVKRHGHKSGDFRVAVLPWEQYPPGMVVGQSKSEAKAAIYKTASVLHANWRSGHQAKVSFMKNTGHWNVSNVDLRVVEHALR